MLAVFACGSQHSFSKEKREKKKARPPAWAAQKAKRKRNKCFGLPVFIVGCKSQAGQADQPLHCTVYAVVFWTFGVLPPCYFCCLFFLFLLISTSFIRSTCSRLPCIHCWLKAIQKTGFVQLLNPNFIKAKKLISIQLFNKNSILFFGFILAKRLIPDSNV